MNETLYTKLNVSSQTAIMKNYLESREDDLFHASGRDVSSAKQPNLLEFVTCWMFMLYVSSQPPQPRLPCQPPNPNRNIYILKIFQYGYIM